MSGSGLASKSAWKEWSRPGSPLATADTNDLIVPGGREGTFIHSRIERRLET
jgi:hypothetical protein